MPVDFFVYLNDPNTGDRKKLIGNFALYPPDRGGKFLLNPQEAVRSYRTGTRSEDARLVLEMKRVDESRPWTPIEVTVGPPIWNRNTR